MMGEGMAPYADTEHRRGFFGFKEHKPDAQTTAADATSTGPELTPAADVSPATGGMGQEKSDADIGPAEAAVTGESTTVESTDMATNVDGLAGIPGEVAKVDLGSVAAEPGVGATETPDVAGDEHVVTPLTPTEDLLGATAEGEADASPEDATADTAMQSEATSEAVLDTTPEAPAADAATSTLESMQAADAGKEDKPVGPDSLMNPEVFKAETEEIDKAMGELNSGEPASDASPAAEETPEETEAPMITATPEITSPASEPAPKADEFPTLNADADSDSVTETPDAVPSPTVPESPLTLVDEAPSTDSIPEVSTTDTSEDTPGANEAVAEELAPVTEADTEVTPAELAEPDNEASPGSPEVDSAKVIELATQLPDSEQAQVMAAIATALAKKAA